MKRTFKILIKILLVIVLTVTTQVGGLILIISEQLSKKIKANKFKRVGLFITIYLTFTILFIPVIAPIFGRVKIKNTEQIQPTNYMTVLLNRNYVKPELHSILIDLAKKLKGTNIVISYLDANFPFIDRFPLLPHLSHSDGAKIDLSLIYEDEKGRISKQQKSVSGYGVFEKPKQGEYSQIETCLKEGYFQYDFPKFLTFGEINKELKFSISGNKRLLKLILADNRIGKLFIEPHLKTRLKLANHKVRYHGCRAVRHDDHIHIQLKK